MNQILMGMGKPQAYIRIFVAVGRPHVKFKVLCAKEFLTGVSSRYLSHVDGQRIGISACNYSDLTIY